MNKVVNKVAHGQCCLSPEAALKNLTQKQEHPLFPGYPWVCAHMVLKAKSDESAVLIIAHTPAARSRAEAKDCPGPFWAMTRRREPKGEGLGST